MDRRRWVAVHAMLFMFAASLTCASLAFAEVLSTPIEERRKTCTTPACQRRGHLIRNSIDPAINPCDDFFQYACGNWIKDNPIPEGASMVGHFSRLAKFVKTNMKDIVENKPFKTEYPNATDKIIMAYQACIRKDRVNRENEEISETKRFLRSLGLKEWPELPESEPAGTWQETAARISPVAVFYTAPEIDVLDPSTYKLNLALLDLMASRSVLVNGSQPEVAPQVEAYLGAMKKVMRLFRPELNESMLSKVAKGVLNFEVKLNKAFSTADDVSESLFTLNVEMTIDELSKGVPEVDWLKFLNTVLKRGKVTVTGDFKVTVVSAGYFKAGLRVMNHTDGSTLRNYFGWSVIIIACAFGVHKINQIFLEHDNATSKNDPPKSLKEECFAQVDKFANKLLDRLYVDSGLAPQATEELKEIIFNLERQFAVTLRTNHWMEEKTAKYAAVKMEKIKVKLLHPDWLMNDDTLNNMYPTLNRVMPNSSYIAFSLALREDSIALLLANVRRPINKTTGFSLSTRDVNAAYNLVENSITIPAGILQAPFYEQGLPKYINMASIGFLIGHEITHAFDNMGMKFNTEGQNLEWWNEKEKEEFNKRKQCFIDQYSNITDNLLKKKLNGRLTQGEDIADNGGVRATYAIFQREKRTARDWYLLPHLENFTIDQTYFLSFATTMCTNVTFTHQLLLHYSDPHNPWRHRINVPLGNLPGFSKAFNCPHDSPMYFKKLCKVW